MSYIVEETHSAHLNLLCYLIESKLGSDSEECLKKCGEYAPEVLRLFKSGEATYVFPLHTGNQIYSKFQLLEFPGHPHIKLRPAIRLPQLQPPLELEDTYKILKSILVYQKIIPRPEAPWLKRINDNYQFTDSILEISPQSSKSLKSNKPTPNPSQLHKTKTSYIKKTQIIKENFKSLYRITHN